MPTLVIAPDSFKGALSAPEVAQAMANGATRALPGATIHLLPIADGGEGTVDAILTATGGQKIKLEVPGSLGEATQAFFGLLPDGTSAVLELAAANGLPLIPPDKRDILRSGTLGTGMLMAHALDMGCRRIYLGIGGSATNDGGIGLASALGMRFLDDNGAPLPPIAQSLSRIAHIDNTHMHPKLAGAHIQAACDVTNPLCGPSGAAAVYGPQKGADAAAIARLDSGLAHLAGVVKRDLGIDAADLPGAGAAGGVGFGLVALLGAKLVPGIDMVLSLAGADALFKECDLVLTGEGQTDTQTAFGKAPVGVAQAAKAHGKPVFLLSGALGRGYEDVYACGIDACFSIADGPMTLDTSMARTASLLEACAHAVCRAWGAGAKPQQGKTCSG
nr:glycerate kinase [bacterium]